MRSRYPPSSHIFSKLTVKHSLRGGREPHDSLDRRPIEWLVTLSGRSEGQIRGREALKIKKLPLAARRLLLNFGESRGSTFERTCCGRGRRSCVPPGHQTSTPS